MSLTEILYQRLSFLRTQTRAHFCTKATEDRNGHIVGEILNNLQT